LGLLDSVAASLFGKTAPISDAAALSDFMDSRAAFLAQKCVVEFCRVRSGVYWQKLFSEKEFQAELAKSRWLSYPPAYAMVAEMTEGALRPAAGIRQRKLPGVLANLAKQTFSRYKVPDETADDFWAGAAELVGARLAATQAGPPRPVRNIPDPTARLVFDALPIHKDIVTNDYDYIFNNLRMNLLRAHEDLLQAGNLEAIAEDLLGAR
jgi:hypothetical protein